MPQPPLGETSQRVAANVRRIRTERGLTIEQLAQVARNVGHQMAPATLGKIERGERRVDVDDADALARALDVPLSALFTDRQDLSEIVDQFLDSWVAAGELTTRAFASYKSARDTEHARWRQLVELGQSSGEARAMVEARMEAHPEVSAHQVQAYRAEAENTAEAAISVTEWKAD